MERGCCWRKGGWKREQEDLRQMERGDSAARERAKKRKKETEREEGLCLISGPGECLG